MKEVVTNLPNPSAASWLIRTARAPALRWLARIKLVDVETTDVIRFVTFWALLRRGRYDVTRIPGHCSLLCSEQLTFSFLATAHPLLCFTDHLRRRPVGTPDCAKGKQGSSREALNIAGM